MIRRRLPQYDPSIDPDLFYWFDASDTSTIKGAGGSAITDGATVYEWLNKGSSPAKMVQSSTYGRPIWRPNSFAGHPGVVFNGSQVLGADDKNGFNGLSGLTFMVACVQTGTPGTSGGRSFHISGGSAQATLGGIAQRADARVWVGCARQLSAGQTDIFAGTWSMNTPIIATGSFNFSGASMHAYREGVLNFAGTHPHGPGVTDWGVPYTVTIGAQHSAGGLFWGFIGPIFEVFLWRRALTPSELVGPHHYLRTKWGIEPSPSSAGGMGLLSEPPPPDYGEGEGESADDLVTLHHYLLAPSFQSRKEIPRCPLSPGWP